MAKERNDFGEGVKTRANQLDYCSSRRGGPKTMLYGSHDVLKQDDLELTRVGH
jgi:hypothetical protein